MLNKILLILLCCTLLAFSFQAEAKSHHHKAHHAKRSNSLNVNARIVMIFDEQNQSTIFNKNSDKISSIASITKLMTAMVVLDANSPMDEVLSIGEDQIHVKKSTSRLKVGDKFTRAEMLQLALMSSENRAALALARAYPGGLAECIKAMNEKAEDLGMEHTKFFEPTGLDQNNKSTANDLVKMVIAASSYPEIHKATTTTSHLVDSLQRKQLMYHNTNPLVSSSEWDINLSKTGYISQSGRCLVMRTVINDNMVVIVILNSKTKKSRISDAKRALEWTEKQANMMASSELSMKFLMDDLKLHPQETPLNIQNEKDDLQ
jgi:serine-type D-Ala-D-Ala endopeptidase (penicillin-binding protein 7)